MQQAAIEIHHREHDGIAVRLFWRRDDDQLQVTVDDSRTGDTLVLPAPPDKALDVFHHPYAYAA